MQTFPSGHTSDASREVLARRTVSASPRAWLALLVALSALGCTGAEIVETAFDAGMDVGPGCATGQSYCPGAAGAVGACATLSVDTANCGTCGHVCGPAQACQAGTCQLTCQTGQTLCSVAIALGDAGTTASLDGGASAVQACVSLATDNNNCGACGTRCPPGEVCSNGGCATTCAAGTSTCTANGSTYCADTTRDPQNCGACGTVCAGGTTCTAGACVVTCASTETDCSGSCRDLTTDNANCGACGTICPAGQVCSMGVCSTTCAAPLLTCGTAPTSFCANATNDPSNCGACGMVCALANTAINGCIAGACTVVTCAPGSGNCDGLATNGCETDLTTSVANCGACGLTCTLPNATATCTASTCGIATCTLGFADCDRIAADGCEVNTQTDNANCGACGASCPAGQVCSHGACAATCAPPLNTCGSGSAAYCADIANDPSNCGACGVACALANVATDGCAMGACTVVSCATGYGNCDGSAAGGCETNLSTSTANCGACGNACSLANATSVCSAGACAIAGCSAGDADCDGLAPDGCEVNTQTDNTNCGACGSLCPAGQVCSHGACSTTCASPLTTCGSGSTAYCADTANNPSNCGACGVACALANVATDGCAAGACTVVSCNPGFGNCDNVASNGCETNLNASATNCGSCGFTCATGQSCTSGTCACPSGQTVCGTACTSLSTDSSNCGACGQVCALTDASSACVAGACAVTACTAGHANCDGLAANGCEVNTQIDGSNCGGCGHACAAGQVCSGGVCGTTCAAPLVTCGSGSTAFCDNTTDDPSNCGACGHVCALANVTTDGCLGSACTVVTCTAGFGNCDGIASNGCETNLSTTAADCGSCGNVCALANATSNCTSGACAISGCNAGHADCDHVAADGCEVNTLSDNANCGGCGTTCPAGQVCSGGVCGTTCASPLTTCGTAPATYCANLTDDPSNCGHCATVCALPNVGTDGCTSSACSIVRCNTGFGDCDGIATDGCETNLNTSTTSCGACGHACSLPNASATCTTGTCAIASCSAGFVNCNGVAADGCEVNTQTDNANCGACSHACAAGQVCSGGSCVSTCASPLSTCGTYCANLTNDPSNCGSCGHVCTAIPNATPVCAGSGCTYVCNAGYALVSGACVVLSAVMSFPITSDSYSCPTFPYFWQAGEEYTGVRATSLPSAVSATIHLGISSNVLSSCGTQNVEFKINGIVVGTFAITAGVTAINAMFTFSAIAGPTYTLEYETTATVVSGCGSAAYDTSGGSTVILTY